MTATYANAPLVEIVAELRWQSRSALAMPASSGGTFQFRRSPSAENAAEEFFMNFAAAVFQNGFQRSERVLPVGLPIPLHQVALRFKKEDAKEVLQVGPGIFTANAVPPYKSWDQFAPSVRSGIECLLRARPDAEKDAPFDAVTLRYINAFNESHTGGMPLRQFLRSVLGFNVSIPSVLMARATESMPNLGLGIQLQLENDLMMTLQVGGGVVKNQESLMYDVTVAARTPGTPDVESLMRILTNARSVIHETFEALVAPIVDNLEPEQN
jgi:uncharacterized protein (TIGR04255 family)